MKIDIMYIMTLIQLPGSLMSMHTENEFAKATVRQVNNLAAYRQQISDDIDDLIARRDQVDEQINGLMAFLRATPGEHRMRLNESAATATDSEPNGTPRRGEDQLSPDNDVADIAYHVLRELGPKDVHYAELADKVKARGGRLPDHKPSATSMLNGILNADPRFLRPFRRGHYSLRDHFPNVKRSVGERRGKK